MLGPAEEVREAREARLELVVADGADPGGRARPRQARHRHGPLRLPRAPATAGQRRRTDDPPGHGRLRHGLRRSGSSRASARRRRAPGSRCTRRTAPRRCASPTSRFDAARCGIALYGLSPFGTDPAEDGLEPVLSLAERAGAGQAAAAGREHGLRPDLRRRPSDVDRDRAGRLRGRLPPRPDRNRGARRRRAPRRSSAPSRWTRSPSSCRGELPAGTPVTLIGDGLLAEEHARGRGHDHVRARRTGIDAGRDRATRERSSMLETCRRAPRAARRRGSSAAPSATSCSAGHRSTSTSPAASPSGPRGRYADAARRRAVPALGDARRRGASRSPDGRTVDFTPLRGSIEDDLATRDFTINAIARPLARRRARRSVRRARRSGGEARARRRRRRLRGRPAPPAARRPLRGRARLRDRAAHRAPGPGTRGAGHASGRRADPRGAAAG